MFDFPKHGQRLAREVSGQDLQDEQDQSARLIPLSSRYILSILFILSKNHAREVFGQDLQDEQDQSASLMTRSSRYILSILFILSKTRARSIWTGFTG